MSTQSPSDFLKQNGGYDPDAPRLPALSWKGVPDGFTIRWTIIGKPEVVPVTSTKSDGTVVTEPKLVLPLRLDEPVQVSVTENGMIKTIQATEVNMWVGRGTLASALDAATTKAGGELVEGGRGATQLTGRKATGKPSPMNLFVCEYQPPAPTGTSVSSLLGG